MALESVFSYGIWRNFLRNEAEGCDRLTALVIIRFGSVRGVFALPDLSRIAVLLRYRSCCCISSCSRDRAGYCSWSRDVRSRRSFHGCSGLQISNFISGRNHPIAACLNCHQPLDGRIIVRWCQAAFGGYCAVAADFVAFSPGPSQLGKR